MKFHNLCKRVKNVSPDVLNVTGRIFVFIEVCMQQEIVSFTSPLIFGSKGVGGL